MVVFFYGGSWQWGSKETYAFAAAALAQEGYVTVVPDYRVYPRVRFPDFLNDGAAAVAWARRHAKEFGADPNRLILMGHSAGAYIAAMLAFDGQWLRKVGIDSRRDLAALIGISGPYDFLPIVDPTIQIVFGGANRPVTQPISFVSGGEPPTLLLQARSDGIVDPSNSTRLALKLRSVGSSVQEMSYPFVGHITIIGTLSPLLRPLAPTLHDINAFIAHLPARQTSAAASHSAEIAQ
jgi:acetyl esterase/lipase